MKEQKYEMMEIQITQMDEVVHVLLNQAGLEIQTTPLYDNSVVIALKKVQRGVMMVTQTIQTDVVVHE